MQKYSIVKTKTTQAGWDVALTTKEACLLEANLSCNLFRGSFDEINYFECVESYFQVLHDEKLARDLFDKKKRQ